MFGKPCKYKHDEFSLVIVVRNASLTSKLCAALVLVWSLGYGHVRIWLQGL